MPAAMPARARSPAVPRGAEPVPPLRILIVEDEALLALQVECLVLDCGHEPVGHAMDSEEAVRLARATAPDLALVDVNLRDGPTGTVLMRALTGELGVAGLFLTANRRLLPPDFAGALGAMPKPFSEVGFEQALRYVAARLCGGAAIGAGGVPARPPAGLELAPSPRLPGGAGAGAALN